MKKIIDTLLFSSVFIAVCAVAMTAQTVQVLSLHQFKPFYFLFVAGGTIASYNFHWYLSDAPVKNNKSERLNWTLKHKAFLLPFAFAGLLIALAAFYFLRENWYWMTVSIIVTFLYSAPKISTGTGNWLKKIAVAKTIYLAFTWTFVTAVLPVIIAHLRINFQGAAFILHRFFFLYALCILFDNRDRKEDKKQGIRSLITIVNENGVGIIFYLSVTLSILFALLYEGIYSTSITGMLLCIPVITLALLFNYVKKNKNDYLYYFLLDGLMILSFLFTSFQQS